MPCYHPLKGYFGKEKTEAGKRPLVFSPTEAYDTGHQVTVPCGKCYGCRLERSRQWATRCLHEASMHKDNCFITLTYNDENLPSNGSLVKEDLQKFWKRLRKVNNGISIRYYSCGEYGEWSHRPHYHCCVFGFDFSDKKLWKVSQGNRLYTSDTLQKIWGKGYCVIGDVTFESAAYVARYIMKKVLGTSDKAEEMRKEQYKDGMLEPEYTVMSRRPGIGSTWIEKYKEDVYNNDYIVVRGHKTKTIRYYDNELKKKSEEELKQIKERRQEDAPYLNNKIARLAGRNTDLYDQTPDRLLVKEAVKVSKMKRFVRDTDKENV